ncbi:MAG: CoA ester lyase, partial [Dehalococcoidia bacterium]|nr:CoA ester lyase [Dehalococcoidia bacterium]
MARLTSVLFVPGIRPPMFEKAKTAPADAICLDLEDSVPRPQKPEARAHVAAAIPMMAAAVAMVLVRVNDATTGLLEDDLNAVIQPGVAGVSLPKVESPDDIRRADHYLTFLERVRGLPVGSVRLLPWIETATGVVRCETILAASPRILAASFGAEDFTANIGIPRAADNPQLLAARLRVALVCKMAGVIPLDTPDPDYRNLDALAMDCRQSRDAGYEGRYCIHPAQLPIVNDAYRPTPDEVERAATIVRVFEEAAAKGHGAVGLEGAMIDIPIV